MANRHNIEPAPLPLAYVAEINGRAPDALTLRWQGKEGHRQARLMRLAGAGRS
jgi:hypothetical protein